MWARVFLCAFCLDGVFTARILRLTSQNLSITAAMYLAALPLALKQQYQDGGKEPSSYKMTYIDHTKAANATAKLKLAQQSARSMYSVRVEYVGNDLPFSLLLFRQISDEFTAFFSQCFAASRWGHPGLHAKRRQNRHDRRHVRLFRHRCTIRKLVQTNMSDPAKHIGSP